MNLRRFFACLPLCPLALAACTHVTLASSRQGIVLEGLPPTAQVYVDRKYWGTGAEVEAMPRQLSTGRHELLIIAPGCLPYYGILHLKANELIRRRPGMFCPREGKGT